MVVRYETARHIGQAAPDRVAGSHLRCPAPGHIGRYTQRLVRACGKRRARSACRRERPDTDGASVSVPTLGVTFLLRLSGVTVMQSCVTAMQRMAARLQDVA